MHKVGTCAPSIPALGWIEQSSRCVAGLEWGTDGSHDWPRPTPIHGDH